MTNPNRTCFNCNKKTRNNEMKRLALFSCKKKCVAITAHKIKVIKKHFQNINNLIKIDKKAGTLVIHNINPEIKKTIQKLKKLTNMNQREIISKAITLLEEII